METNKRHEVLALVCADYLEAIPPEATQKSETVVVAFDLADPVARSVARDLAHDLAGSGRGDLSAALATVGDDRVLILTDTTRAAMRAALVKNGRTKAASQLASPTVCDGWFVTMAEGRTQIGMVPIGVVQ